MGSNINTRKFLSRRYSGIYILTGVSYNPDYLLVKNAIESTGVTLTSTQNTAGNTLVNQLQSYNLWTKLKAIYGILGGTAGAHKWNWKDPRDLNAAYRLSFSTGWTHSSTGMTPNGTSAYADTFLIPSTSLTLYNTHLSFYSRSNTPLNSDSDIGAMYYTTTFSYTAYMTLKRSFDNNAIGYLTNDDTNRVSYSPTTAAYFGILSRISNNSLKIYNNGVLKATNTVIPVAFNQGLPLNKILISALNYYDGTTNSILAYSSKQCAFASTGDGLTDTEASNLYTAVQNYNTTLGRQV